MVGFYNDGSVVPWNVENADTRDEDDGTNGEGEEDGTLSELLSKLLSHARPVSPSQLLLNGSPCSYWQLGEAWEGRLGLAS